MKRLILNLITILEVSIVQLSSEENLLSSMMLNFHIKTNIIQNSSHYADRKDVSVSVKLKAVGKLAEIIITDNGIGIPEERLPFIFDRFFRGDDSRNQNSGGSGLVWLLRESETKSRLGD